MRAARKRVVIGVNSARELQHLLSTLYTCTELKVGEYSMIRGPMLLQNVLNQCRNIAALSWTRCVIAWL
jgi:hypothetical protein